MRNMVPKRDTRHKILTKAFFMYEDLGNRKISLSEIAAKVGISKTAIFRHFKNKDALIIFTDGQVSLDIYRYLQIKIKKCLISTGAK